MALDTLKPSDAGKGPDSELEAVKLYVDDDGRKWYLDKDRKVTVLDEPAISEFNRQQMEPGTAPLAGFPKFPRRMSIGEMPVAPGEIAPPEVPTAGTGAEKVKSTPTPEEHLEEARAELVERLGKIPADHVNPDDLAWFKGVINGSTSADEFNRHAITLTSMENKEKTLNEIRASLSAGGGGIGGGGESPEEKLRTAKVALVERFRQSTDRLNLEQPERFQQWVDEARSPSDLSSLETMVAGFESTGQASAELQALINRRMNDMNQRRDALAAGGGAGSSPPPGGGGGEPPRPAERPPGAVPIIPPDGASDWMGRDPREYLGIPQKTIDDILANERDALLFGEAFKEMHPGAEALLLRYRTHTQSQPDMEVMRHAAHEYCYRLKLAEDVKGKLTPSQIELLSRPSRNPILADLMAHRKAPRANEVIHNAVFHLAMENPALVEEMREAFSDLGKLRATREFKGIQKEVWALSERNGIQASEFSTLFKTKTRGERIESRAFLEKRIHDSAGRFRKAMDWTRRYFGATWMPGSSLNLARSQVARAREVNEPSNARRREIRDAIDSNLHFIARHLGDAITHPEWRELISKETLTNKNAVLARESGPQTFTQMQEAIASAENSPATIERRVRERIAANPAYAGWDSAEQDNWLRNDVMQDELRKQRGLGFWAWLFSALLGRNVQEGINKAAGHAIFAT